MQRFLPPKATARDEQEYGCWRLTYDGERLRSWSYYERGDGRAMKEALNTLWTAYHDDTGHTCPYEAEIAAIPDD